MVQRSAVRRLARTRWPVAVTTGQFWVRRDHSLAKRHVSGASQSMFQAYTAARAIRVMRSAVDYRHLPDFSPLQVMDNSTSKATKAEAPSNGPIKVIRIDDVSVSIFARDRMVQGDPVTFYSVSLSRSYENGDGERKYTKNFDEEDLGKVMTLAKQAGEFIAAARASKEPARK